MRWLHSEEAEENIIGSKDSSLISALSLDKLPGRKQNKKGCSFHGGDETIDWMIESENSAGRMALFYSSISV